MPSALQYVVLGAGGHAKVVIETLRAQGKRVVGAVAPQSDQSMLDGVSVVIAENLARDRWPVAEVRCVVGIGSVGDPSLRVAAFEDTLARGFLLGTAVHPSAVISGSATLGDGTVAFAGAIVQAQTVVGDNVIINTGAIIDHGCAVGSHVHLAPRATLVGGVIVGDGAHIGAGAIVLQGLKIGPRAIIGAGAVVTEDVDAGVTVVGVPARPISL